MATRDPRGMGIDHLTVVPENIEREPSSEEETGDTAAAGDGDGE